MVFGYKVALKVYVNGMFLIVTFFYKVFLKIIHIDALFSLTYKYYYSILFITFLNIHFPALQISTISNKAIQRVIRLHMSASAGKKLEVE